MLLRSSYREVHVRLGDKNDHSPVFEKEEYHVSVSEAALVNTPITKLKVSKIEISPDINRRSVFSIVFWI